MSFAQKAAQGGGKRANVRAMAKQTEAKQSQLEQQYKPAEYLNAQLAKDQRDGRYNDVRFPNAPLGGQKPFYYPQGAYNLGHYLESDSKADTHMNLKQAMLARGNPQTGATPYGLMTVSDKDISAIVKKKEMQQNYEQMQLATYAIDPLRPETQDMAYAIWPELQEIPEQFHMEELTLQETLRVMLRDGKLGGREDHELIFHILRPDFKLPIHPLWDPDGAILDSAYQGAGIKTVNQQLGVQRGLFSPRNWDGTPALSDEKMMGIQNNLKAMILQRLYPGLHFKSHKWILDNVVTRYAHTDFTGREGASVVNMALGTDNANGIQYAPMWWQSKLPPATGSSYH